MQWIEQLASYAHDQLGEREREALWSRGVSDEQITSFQVGYLNRRLPDLGFPKDFMEWCWEGRKFDEVFCLPLTNTLGQIKGLQFRHVDRNRPGYSDYIPYEDEPILFGFSQAMPHVWRTEAVWVVEGSFDLFPIQRHEPNVIATLTARLTRQVTTVLRRLVKEIWLGYDMDKTGREASDRIQKTHGREFQVRSVIWPRVKKLDGTGYIKDPSDLWEVWGDERLATYLKRPDTRR